MFRKRPSVIISILAVLALLPLSPAASSPDEVKKFPVGPFLVVESRTDAEGAVPNEWILVRSGKDKKAVRRIAHLLSPGCDSGNLPLVLTADEHVQRWRRDTWGLTKDAPKPGRDFMRGVFRKKAKKFRRESDELLKNFFAVVYRQVVADNAP